LRPRAASPSRLGKGFALALAAVEDAAAFAVAQARTAITIAAEVALMTRIADLPMSVDPA